MNLYDIHNPDNIKKMSIKELEGLAHDIREFLITNVSKTGGHLPSNLGTVELTIAAHYVFNSPTDKIFFDVGHQCYTHKILTGRAKDFPTLRHYNGISGFEKRCESEHDVWEAGHSSTSLSAALGMAVARDLKHEHYDIVPIIGDGAMSSGMSLEALNQIGEEQRKMIIIFNDNNMSISKNVGAMTKNFARMRASKSYNSLKEGLKDNLKKNEFGEVIYSGLKSFRDNLRDSIVEDGVFGEFGLYYMGPVDGHNLHDLIQVFNVAKHHNGPVIIHCITQKGRGYAPCENDHIGKWHGVGPFNRETGKPLHETPDGYKAWSAVFSDTVMELAEKDPLITAITPAMITGSSLLNFFSKYPERSFDCGIAEEHAATFAAGQAISGLKPYFCVYSSFLQRCYDQINHDICRMDLPVVIGIDHAGLVGNDGETHHGVFDISFLKVLPNMILAQPKNAQEAIDLLYTAFHQSHPFGIRYPKGVTEVKNLKEGSLLEVGSWEVHTTTENDKVIVFTYGSNVETVLSKVRSNSMPVTVINCRFLKPLDEQTLQNAVKSGLPGIVYETDMKAGGLAESILGWMCDKQVTMPLRRIGIPDEYVAQGEDNRLRKDEHIDLNTLLQLVNEII